MNKSELIDAVVETTGLSKAQVAEAVTATFGAVHGALSEGKHVTIVGFGTFRVRERAGRSGINPATKAKIEIPASKSVHFKPGKLLATAVRGN